MLLLFKGGEHFSEQASVANKPPPIGAASASGALAQAR